MAPTIPTQQDLVEREFALTEGAKTLGLEPFFAICKDREERYREFLAAMSVPEELEAWVGQMKHRFTKEFEVDDGPVDVVPAECLVWHNPIPLPWLVGLLVVMYGEHEYFWPKKFGKAEIQRAEGWLNGPAMSHMQVGSAGLTIVPVMKGSRPPRADVVRPCYVLPKGGE